MVIAALPGITWHYLQGDNNGNAKIPKSKVCKDKIYSQLFAVAKHLK